MKSWKRWVLLVDTLISITQFAGEQEMLSQYWESGSESDSELFWSHIKDTMELERMEIFKLY